MPAKDAAHENPLNMPTAPVPEKNGDVMRLSHEGGINSLTRFSSFYRHRADGAQ